MNILVYPPSRNIGERPWPQCPRQVTFTFLAEPGMHYRGKAELRDDGRASGSVVIRISVPEIASSVRHFMQPPPGDTDAMYSVTLEESLTFAGLGDEQDVVVTSTLSQGRLLYAVTTAPLINGLTWQERVSGV